MLRASLKWVGRSSLLLVAAVACSDRMSPPPPVPLPACTGGRGFAVSLAVDSFVSVDCLLATESVMFSSNSSAIDDLDYLRFRRSASASLRLPLSFLSVRDALHHETDV